jgi:acetoin utilization deacetylase AcuC-like enzyme
MIPIFFSPSFVGSGYAFDTTRKSKWVADSLNSQPISGLALRVPQPLTHQQVIEAHDPNYVLAVETGKPRSLAESQGFPWDIGLWPMVLASNGGAVEAALAALQSGVAGSLSSGLHHARYEHGTGFCTFNGLAIAAYAALHSGAKSVLILDFDAHCGGGTHSLVKEKPQIWQLDVSVSSFDAYEPSARTSLSIVHEAKEYLPLIVNRLKELESQAPRFDLCLYNAGMDPHEDCDIGGLVGITSDLLAVRERIVFKWCEERRIPVAFVLAGGYIGSKLAESGLLDLHRLTLSAAARISPSHQS